MYVALTRARHQTVLWWAGSYFGKDSALTRILFCRQLDGSIGLGLAKPPSDAEAMEALQRVADRAPGCIAVEQALLTMPSSWSGELRTGAELSTADFNRVLDLQWRRTSYSAITAGAHEALVSSEPETPGSPTNPQSMTRSCSAAIAEPALMAAANRAGRWRWPRWRPGLRSAP